ncbi:MAG: formimidoylglutamate deiminase, partial [Marmoricola sp.]
MRLHLQHALLESGVEAGVLLETEDGWIKTVRVEGRSLSLSGDASVDDDRFPRPAGETSGLTLPTLANCHSHAFHRALRGRTQRERGSFWTWREQMYAVAAELTPDTYFELARDTYAEMRATGIGAVGEFHYLHHQPDGTPYDDPNEMGKALLAAADEA